MPREWSDKQKKLARIAEHEPEKLYKRNKSILSMDKEDMHALASMKNKKRGKK